MESGEEGDTMDAARTTTRTAAAVVEAIIQLLLLDVGSGAIVGLL